MIFIVGKVSEANAWRLLETTSGAVKVVDSRQLVNKLEDRALEIENARLDREVRDIVGFRANLDLLTGKHAQATYIGNNHGVYVFVNEHGKQVKGEEVYFGRYTINNERYFYDKNPQEIAKKVFSEMSHLPYAIVRENSDRHRLIDHLGECCKKINLHSMIGDYPYLLIEDFDEIYSEQFEKCGFVFRRGEDYVKLIKSEVNSENPYFILELRSGIDKNFAVRGITPRNTDIVAVSMWDALVEIRKCKAYKGF